MNKGMSATPDEEEVRLLREVAVAGLELLQIPGWDRYKTGPSLRQVEALRALKLYYLSHSEAPR